MSHTNPAAGPWYKQPWLWFILTPLIAVFIYGFLFLYISIVTHDGVVKDDYYKVARGIEIDQSRVQHTQDLGLQAGIRLDMLTGDILLKLSGKLETMPEYLNLAIIHPTHKNYDQTITLRQQPGTAHYIGSLQGTVLGKRYLTVSPENNDWRLRTEVNVPKMSAESSASNEAVLEANFSAN